MEISSCNSKDTDKIIALFAQVFSDSEGESEGKIVGQLVAELFAETEDLISYVAVSKGEIVACICFSDLLLSSQQTAVLLSPVAVVGTEQGKGVGQKIISHGLEQLKSRGTDFVFTYGDPNFYSRVGFEQVNEAFVNAPFKLSYPEGWLAKALNGKDLQSLRCHTRCVGALNKQTYW